MRKKRARLVQKRMTTRTKRGSNFYGTCRIRKTIMMKERNNSVGGKRGVFNREGFESKKRIKHNVDQIGNGAQLTGNWPERQRGIREAIRYGYLKGGGRGS